MSAAGEFETRLTAVEAHVERLDADVSLAGSDAAAARHLAAARDHDLADLTIKVEANRSVLNALGVQTAARFDQLEQRVDEGFAEMRAEMRARFEVVDLGFVTIGAKFEQVDRGFAEMRAKFDQTAAGMERIVELLTDRDDR